MYIEEYRNNDMKFLKYNGALEIILNIGKK